MMWTVKDKIRARNVWLVPGLAKHFTEIMIYRLFQDMFAFSIFLIINLSNYEAVKSGDWRAQQTNLSNS